MLQLYLQVVVLLSCSVAMAQTAEPLRLTSDGQSKRDPVFLNPEGTELLYVLLEKPNQLRLMKLTLADLASSQLHPSEIRSEFEPAVSADGSHIAFVQNRCNLSLAMVIHDQTQKQVGEVPPGAGFSGMHSPTFSPDGSTIFFSYLEDGRHQIYSVNLQGQDRRTVIDSPGVNNWPTISPDSRSLVFSSTRDDDYEIYTSKLDGTNPHRLTNSPTHDLRPRFSPDGSRIAFTSNRDGNYEIYLMTANGDHVARLTNNPELDDFPLWAPDGKSLIIATSITNNASFNCLATKVIVTWKNWPQRDSFLELIRRHLAQTPVRPAYYPGAVERFQRFSGTSQQPDERGCLPWTLLTGQSIVEHPELFKEESFVCVCAETQLGGDTPEQFLSAATEFVNDQLTGTLCASVTIPPGFRAQQATTFERCLAQLRYGSVCVNQWSGLAYGLTSPPWGAYPGATVKDVQSGIGNVHNTYLLDHVEKTVLEGPLVNFPKPIWFPSHRNAVDVAKRLMRLYQNPSVLHLPGLFAAAISG